jgi:HAD superfamily hydrolase (TIGR01490 family)
LTDLSSTGVASVGETSTLRQAAFFDLDKTVIAKASMMAFGRPFYREGLIGRRTIVRGIYAQLVYLHLGASEQKLARIRESVLTLTRGWEQARVSSIVRETLEAVIEPILFEEALELMDLHRAEGRRIYLVSASPSEIVEPLAEYLGVDQAIASRAAVDDEGRYTGEMDTYAYGPYKATIMQELAVTDGIDLAGSYAYSDSYTDVPMLEAVGHPVAVNPDRVLAKVARERQWEVRQFVRTVRMRDRRPVPRPVPTAAAGAGLVIIAGGVIWWRARHTGGAAHHGPAARPTSARGWAALADRRPEQVLGRRGAQSTRSFLAAAKPNATRMARMSSFFMSPR